MRNRTPPDWHERPVYDSSVKRGVPTPDAPSVSAYFVTALGYELAHFTGRGAQGTLPDTISVATPAGRSCRSAIDGAATLLAHVHAAFGCPGTATAHRESKSLCDGIARAAARVVCCYVYG